MAFFLDLVKLGVCLVGGLFTVLLHAIIYVVVMDCRTIIPMTLDHSPDWHNPPRIDSYPALNNALLLLLFILQHSLMPRGPLKKVLRMFFSEDYYRPFYVFVTCILLCIIFYCWKPMPTVVWEIQQPQLWYGVMGLNQLFWICLILSNINLDPVALLGIREPLQKLGWGPAKSYFLVDTGLYGLVRHPIYLFLLLAFSVVPKMTQGHLLFAVVLTLYTVLIVIYYEEPDLVKKLGPAYERYMEKTPRFFPIPWLYGKTTTKPKAN